MAHGKYTNARNIIAYKPALEFWAAVFSRYKFFHNFVDCSSTIKSITLVFVKTQSALYSTQI